MFYGYCRVSTRKQLDGNGLEAQRQEIADRYKDVNIVIIEEQYTGAKLERPKFTELVNNLKAGDTLVVTKLDRLARDTVEGIQVVEKLFEKGVAVHVLNVGLLEKTSMGKFFLTTLLAVAEMERNTILERTLAGKEIAKQRPNFTEGRPRKFNPAKVEKALDEIESGKLSYREAERIYNISKSTLTRRMRERKANLIETSK